MKLIIAFTLVFLSYLLYGFYLSLFELNSVPSNLKRENPRGFYDYRGVSNVRTQRSDGSETPIGVIGDAKRAGLDFLIITDANQYGKTEDIVTGYHGNLLVLDEGEFSHLDSRLLLYSSAKHDLPQDPNSANIYFTDLLSQKVTDHQNQLLFLATPFNPNETWTGQFPTGINGIEVLNPKSMSQKAWLKSRLNVIWSLICYPFNPKFAFLRLYNDPIDEIALWDRIAKERMIVGAAGADASARAVPWADYLLKFPSYQRSFEIFANHVLLDSELTGQMQKDRSKILSALRKGQFYFSMDYIGDPKGFNAIVRDRDKIHPMGSKIKFSKNLKLHAEIPTEPTDFYEMVIFKNGERDATVNHTEISYDIPGPGQYRVVVRVIPPLPFPDGKRWLTWIFSNIFYVE